MIFFTIPIDQASIQELLDLAHHYEVNLNMDTGHWEVHRDHDA